jgi:hypothetical protein
MLNSGKYLIAAPGQASRPMTLSDVNLGLASGEVLPDDQYWIKGMPRWEKVREMQGVILPPTPKVRVQNGSSTSVQTAQARPDAGPQNRAGAASGTLSFWAQPDHKPRAAVWSPAMYLGLSIPFTPLMGTIMVVQNHRAAAETVWRGIALFWLVVWAVVVVAAGSLHLASIPCGPPMYWLIGYGLLVLGWCFTCALPHGKFLNTRAFEAAWRSSWGRPLAFGFAGWIVVAAVYFLTR